LFGCYFGGESLANPPANGKRRTAAGMLGQRVELTVIKSFGDTYPLLDEAGKALL